MLFFSSFLVVVVVVVVVVMMMNATCSSGGGIVVLQEAFQVAARVTARPVQDVLVLLRRPHAVLPVVLVPPPLELLRRRQLTVWGFRS
jgi:hypothetical protein